MKSNIEALLHFCHACLLLLSSYIMILYIRKKTALNKNKVIYFSRFQNKVIHKNHTQKKNIVKAYRIVLSDL